MTSASFPIKQYTPRHQSWPYKSSDFDRYDPTPDNEFYTHSRLVTHIDDHAISALERYYDETLPKKGRILDFCSSWISHYPKGVQDAAKSGELEVVGMGMNQIELDRNEVLSKRVVQDLNEDPNIPDIEELDAATCVVSIDYLTKPVEVLQSIRSKLREGGVVHLAISNRCFPTKAISRWLKVDEEERLELVGDYLHFAGFKNIEIVTLCDGTTEYKGRRIRVDPLWVVRGKKAGLETGS